MIEPFHGKIRHADSFHDAMARVSHAVWASVKSSPPRIHSIQQEDVRKTGSDTEEVRIIWLWVNFSHQIREELFGNLVAHRVGYAALCDEAVEQYYESGDALANTESEEE